MCTGRKQEVDYGGGTDDRLESRVKNLLVENVRTKRWITSHDANTPTITERMMLGTKTQEAIAALVRLSTELCLFCAVVKFGKSGMSDERAVVDVLLVVCDISLLCEMIVYNRLLLELYACHVYGNARACQVNDFEQAERVRDPLNFAL